MATSIDTAGVLNSPGAEILGRSRWLNILPVVFIMYTIEIFDRANIGIALPFMSKDLGLTGVQAGLVGAVVNWGYVITQLSAGWIALKLGTRNVIGYALVLWGAAAMGTGLARNFEELAAARILLGFFEGPVFAATSIMLAQWFMKPERGRAFGTWNLSSPVGAILAGPISGFLLAHYDWRLMMIVEGLPAWIWAALWWWRIPATMEKATWLPPEERTYVVHAIAREQAELATPEREQWWTILTEPAVWLTFGGFSLFNLLLTGVTLWLPSLLKTVHGLPIGTIGVITALPFATSTLGMYLITHHSDRHGQERRWHAALPCLITGVLLIIAALVPTPLYILQIVLFVILGFTMKMFLPLIYTHLTELLPKAKAVNAIAVCNGLGNLVGGTVGSVLIGYIWQQTGSFTMAFVGLGISGIVGGLLLALVRDPPHKSVPALPVAPPVAKS